MYPADDQRKSSPWTIGSNLRKKLLTQFNVVMHEWDANYTIAPSNNEILLGHPHPKANTVFRKSFDGPWSHRFVICPFTTNPQQMYFVEPYARQANAFFAICGPTWAKKLPTSLYSHLSNRFIPTDMGIEPNNWPPLDREFSPPHQRRFAYIGSSLALKGTPFLEMISAQRDPNEFSWIGASNWIRTNTTKFPFTDLQTTEGRDLLSKFDFIFSPGKSDANPTVLLEAMSLGLIPVCTRESGYDDDNRFYVMNYGQIDSALNLCDELQVVPCEELEKRRNSNFLALREYSWAKFTDTVLSEINKSINSNGATPMLERPKGFYLRQFYRSSVSPYRRWRNTQIVKLIENRVYYYLAKRTKLLQL